jgi:hypothetical protein
MRIAIAALALLGCSCTCAQPSDSEPPNMDRVCLDAEPNLAGQPCSVNADCTGANPGECADLECIGGVCEFMRQALGRACNGGAWSCTEMMQCCKGGE